MRYQYMSQTQVTSLPEDISMFQRRAAKIVHISLYINFSGYAKRICSDCLSTIDVAFAKKSIK
jgi:hypothetical protein